MNIEAAVYLLLASCFAILGQMLSGQDNGAFYAKGIWTSTGGGVKHPNQKLLDELITPVFQNFHRNETPTWYCRFGAYSFLLFTVLRYHHSFDHHVIISIVATLLMTMSCSGIASPTYQCYINVSVGDPCINPDEGKISEFALGKWSIKWKRPFSGKKRILARYLGIVCFIAGFIIGFILYK